MLLFTKTFMQNKKRKYCIFEITCLLSAWTNFLGCITLQLWRVPTDIKGEQNVNK